MKTWKVRCSIHAAVPMLLAVAVLSAAERKENRDDWQQPQRVVSDLGLKTGQTIADIGCGRGYFTFRLAKAVGDRGKVYATDIDPVALKAVSEQAEKAHVKNVQTILSEPTNTKLTSASLDSAAVIDVLHHVPKDKRLPLIQDVSRALKPGGFLFIIDWRVDAEIKHDLNNRIPKDDLVKLAQEARLVMDAEFYYLKHQVFLRFRKPDFPK